MEKEKEKNFKVCRVLFNEGEEEGGTSNHAPVVGGGGGGGGRLRGGPHRGGDGGAGGCAGGLAMATWHAVIEGEADGVSRIE